MVKVAPKIGAYVLDTLTTGMYSEPLDALREIIQNASDSIRSARVAGLCEAEQGEISIVLSPEERTITVRDNGTGIQAADVERKLLNIGMSDKDITQNSGFRGIGRLASIAYCDTLYFRTRAKGERKISVIELDCKGLRAAILPDKRQTGELSSVIAEHALSDLEDDKSAPPHFFEVVLKKVTPAADIFLDHKAVEKYLQQVAPVGFDASKFMFAPVVMKWIKDNHVPFFSVNVKLEWEPNGSRYIYKPYKGHYSTRVTKDTVAIQGIKFFPEKLSPDCPYWIWYGDSTCPGMIDHDTAAGFRIRLKNIGIGGPERVDELFGENTQSDTRFNSYFIGEIHVVDSSVIPNARRDGFEATATWLAIKQKLIAFAKERKLEIRDKSKIRNLDIEKLSNKTTKVLQDVEKTIGRGLASKEERDELAEKLTKADENLEEALKGEKSPTDVETINGLRKRISTVKDDLANKNSFAGQRLKSSLDKRERKIIAEILAILREILDERQYTKANDAILEKFGIKTEDFIK